MRIITFFGETPPNHFFGPRRGGSNRRVLAGELGDRGVWFLMVAADPVITKIEIEIIRFFTFAREATCWWAVLVLCSSKNM